LIKYYSNFFTEEEIFDVVALKVLPNAKYLEEKIHKEISSTVNKQLKKYPFQMEFVVYDMKPTESMGVHYDFSYTTPPHISVVVYLSSEFEGGEIYFPDQDLAIKPSKGALLFYDSNIRHEVKEIRSGNRSATGVFWDIDE
jgi:predicted 2-oxoglutarate/Fe(II)-dependent dioxygenase YbiX